MSATSLRSQPSLIRQHSVVHTGKQAKIDLTQNSSLQDTCSSVWGPEKLAWCGCWLGRGGGGGCWSGRPPKEPGKAQETIFCDPTTVLFPFPGKLGQSQQIHTTDQPCSGNKSTQNTAPYPLYSKTIKRSPSSCSVSLVISTGKASRCAHCKREHANWPVHFHRPPAE